ncbi:MAG: B12-binding domain-containing protein, partial [Eubacteriales bacterium]|nr:B12-binding domain-containing protein [Eubacteriales bacterium]
MVSDAVQNGDRKNVGGYVKEALEAGCKAIDILNIGMIGAMDIVGDN